MRNNGLRRVTLITIFGDKDFYQLEKVIEKLRKKSDNVVIVDYKDDNELLVNISNDGNTHIEYSGNNISDSKLIWRADKYLVPYFGNTTKWASEFMKAKVWKSTVDNVCSIVDVPIIID